VQGALFDQCELMSYANQEKIASFLFLATCEFRYQVFVGSRMDRCRSTNMSRLCWILSQSTCSCCRLLVAPQHL
jgi:hypothetical protein